jgi:hypothetical protein
MSSCSGQYSIPQTFNNALHRELDNPSVDESWIDIDLVALFLHFPMKGYMLTDLFPCRRQSFVRLSIAEGLLGIDC